MPAAVTYTTVLGQVLMENRGGIVTEFVPDPLGSVVKHKDSTGAYVHSAEYWPYGEIQTSSGNNPGPFAYCGTWGYYRDSASQTYVRARYYKPVQGRWMTVDPLWPREYGYAYVGTGLMSSVDYTGLQVGSGKIIILPPKPGWWPKGVPYPRILPNPGILPFPGSKCEKPPKDYVLPYPYYDGNLLKWGYGNWCGKDRPGKGNKKGKPVDSLDGCCQAHDSNLGTDLVGGKEGCAHCMLLRCAKGVDCSKSVTPQACVKARSELITLMTGLCLAEIRLDLKCLYM